MVIVQIDLVSGKEIGSPLVAVDTVGSGIGEVVMMVGGSSARQTSYTENKPVDAAIIGIIDSIEIEGNIVFRK